MFGLLDRIDRMNAGIHHASESVPGLPVHEAVLLRMLLMTGNAVVEEIERILKPHGLSDSDFRTLMMVYTAPGGSTSPSELCEGRVVDRLLGHALAESPVPLVGQS